MLSAVILTDAQIHERDGGRCARCAGNRGGLHVHHRWLRSAGEDERACNRVTLCSGCHRWAHMHPQDAMGSGWIVSRYDDPLKISVQHWMWPAGPILLDADGGVILVIEDDE